MREILKLCVELDGAAASAYRTMSGSCPDEKLATVFLQMAHEEDAHVRWWTELLESWERGLIPDIVTDPDAIMHKLLDIEEHVSATMPEGIEELSCREMLELAVRLEFFMLDPLFGELIEFTEPGRSRYHREAYTLHINRLIEAIETHHETGELARFLAQVLKRALRDNAMLATYATRDPLTGLYNRRGMLAHLEHWLYWSHRYRRPLMVLLVDIDRFKEINDSHGHAAGDRILADVARALESSTRESDFVARYGGDEFAIVAPEADIDEYPAIAERVLGAVRTVECPHHDSGCMEVSVSMGGAMLALGTEVTPLTADLLLAAADSSMYAGKAAGRDRAGAPAIVDAEAIVEAKAAGHASA